MRQGTIQAWRRPAVFVVTRQNAPQTWVPVKSASVSCGPGGVGGARFRGRCESPSVREIRGAVFAAGSTDDTLVSLGLPSFIRRPVGRHYPFGKPLRLPMGWTVGGS